MNPFAVSETRLLTTADGPAMPGRAMEFTNCVSGVLIRLGNHRSSIIQKILVKRSAKGSLTIGGAAGANDG